MMKKYLGSVALAVLVVACDSPKQLSESETGLEISQEVLAAQALQARQTNIKNDISRIADSLQSELPAYTKLLKQVQDSIEHTGVHPMLQEETINRYQNVHYRLRAAQEEFLRWREADSPSADTLSDEQKINYLQDRYQSLKAVESQLKSARQQAYSAMQEDRM